MRFFIHTVLWWRLLDVHQSLFSPSFWDYTHTEFPIPSLQLFLWQWILGRNDIHLWPIHLRNRYYFSKISSLLFGACGWYPDSKRWCNNRAYILDSAHAREPPTNFHIHTRLCVWEQEINFYFEAVHIWIFLLKWFQCNYLGWALDFSFSTFNKIFYNCLSILFFLNAISSIITTPVFLLLNYSPLLSFSPLLLNFIRSLTRCHWLLLYFTYIYMYVHIYS